MSRRLGLRLGPEKLKILRFLKNILLNLPANLLVDPGGKLKPSSGKLIDAEFYIKNQKSFYRQYENYR